MAKRRSPLKRVSRDLIVTRNGAEARLINSDCIAAMNRLAPDSIDAVVTSPPYNIGVDYGDVYDDKMARDEYLAWLDHAFDAIFRVLKPNGSFFLNVGGTLKDPMIPYQVLDVATRRFTLQNNITWIKSVTVGDRSNGHFKPVSSPRFLNNCFEHVFHLTKGGDVALDRLAIGVPFADKSNTTRWSHGRDKRCRGNVWFIPYETIRSKSQKMKHPAIFPRELVTNCLKLHGKVDGPARPVVLDPFAGIGTTMVAAAELGWDSIGLEIDRRWHQAAAAILKNSD